MEVVREKSDRLESNMGQRMGTKVKISVVAGVYTVQGIKKTNK